MESLSHHQHKFWRCSSGYSNHQRQQEARQTVNCENMSSPAQNLSNNQNSALRCAEDAQRYGSKMFEGLLWKGNFAADEYVVILSVKFVTASVCYKREDCVCERSGFWDVKSERNLGIGELINAVPSGAGLIWVGLKLRQQSSMLPCFRPEAWGVRLHLWAQMRWPKADIVSV